jgi:regulatory protein
MINVHKLKKKRNGYLITFKKLDETEEEFLLSEDLVVEFRLVEGKQLDPTKFQVFLKAYAVDKVYQKISSLLMKNPKTIKETRKYLENEDLSAKQVTDILVKLSEQKYLNDNLYTKLYVDYQITFKKNGPIKVKYELEHKGIPEELANQYIAQVKDSVYYENLEYLWRKEQLKHRSKPMNKTIIMTKVNLMQKGYPIGIVTSFIDGKKEELAKDNNDIELLQKDYEKAKKRYVKYREMPYEFKRKLLQFLMNKGYQYSDIQTILKGDQYDELQDIGF